MSNLLPSQGTKFVKDADIRKDWILVDAREQVLGRLAGRIAHRLRGKHRPDYAPHQNVGDYVIVVNARHIKVTGSKLQKKKYHHHSRFPGGLRTDTLQHKMESDPTFALSKAVQRMLPKGHMGRKLFNQLHIYADDQHPHQAQQPKVWEPRYR